MKFIVVSLQIGDAVFECETAEELHKFFRTRRDELATVFGAKRATDLVKEAYEIFEKE